MAIGNIGALVQTNITRLLAYSTIAHAGYMLLGLLVLSQAGLSSLLYYLASYLFANLGAFAVVIYVNSLTGSDSIQSYAGLIRKRPALTLLFTIFLLSLSGMPITAGFFGKFFLFQAVAQAGVGHMWLVMVALLTSTISMYYYLNVVRLMVIADPSPEVEALESEGANLSLSPIGASLAICAFATIVIGVLAEPFLSVMSNSVRDINSFGVGSLSHNNHVQPLQQQAQAQALQLKVVANKTK
jgi:NAD(P)H-quinone oxidoreductase subunit 2